ncbi:MAG: hypothetical protein HUU08_15075 [Candidatus Brocadia sp.]|nr:hypothetical protein [Candidatus Brocadia sp.]
MTKYLLLMRHGSHESSKATSSEQYKQRKLSDKGEKHTREVSGALAEVLQAFGGQDDIKISIGAVWRAGTDEVVATLDVVKNVLWERLQCNIEPIEKHVKELDPSVFNPYINTESHIAFVKSLADIFSKMKTNNAVFIIGHQPFLGWVTHEVVGKAIPIDRSGLLCIALKNVHTNKRLRGYLQWVLSPSDENTEMEIKEKIKSKMEMSKFLSVFISTGLVFLLGSILDKDKVEYPGSYILALYASTGLLFMSIGLYLASMYAYDRLLMPTRFWADVPPLKKHGKRPAWLVWRPPSSSLWVLYQNMMRIWRYLFTPATYIALLGILFLAIAVFRPSQPVSIIGTVLAVLTGLILFWFYYRHFGPKIGSED